MSAFHGRCSREGELGTGAERAIIVGAEGELQVALAQSLLPCAQDWRLEDVQRRQESCWEVREKLQDASIGLHEYSLERNEIHGTQLVNQAM